MEEGGKGKTQPEAGGTRFKKKKRDDLLEAARRE